MPRTGTGACLCRHAWLAGVACLIAGAALYIWRTAPDRALLGAGIRGDNRAALALLRTGVDPRWHDEKGRSAVAEAALYGNTDTMFLLLDHGADVGDALWGAVWRPRPTLVRQIFARRPDAATHWHYHIPLMKLAQSKGDPTVRAVKWGLERAQKGP